MLLRVFSSVGVQFIHDNAVIPLPEADAVWYGWIKSSARAIGINRSSDLCPDFLLRDILNIYFRAVNAADHGKLSLCLSLDFHNIVLRNRTLPDIHADFHHICDNRLADTVRMVHINHTAGMNGIRDLFLQRFNDLARRKKNIPPISPWNGAGYPEDNTSPRLP